MINGANNSLTLDRVTGAGAVNGSKQSAPTSGANFSDALQKSVDEVSRLQQEASKAVDDVAAGKNDNVDGVMTAVEKSDLAFKTLLAIRAKLMDAYDEIKGIAL